MKCPFCQHEIKLSNENIVVSVVELNDDEKLDIELICDNQRCGETAAYTFVSTNQFCLAEQ